MITKIPPEILDFFFNQGKVITHKGKIYLTFEFVIELIDQDNQLVDLIPTKYFPEELKKSTAQTHEHNCNCIYCEW